MRTRFPNLSVTRTVALWAGWVTMSSLSWPAGTVKGTPLRLVLPTQSAGPQIRPPHAAFSSEVVSGLSQVSGLFPALLPLNAISVSAPGEVRTAKLPEASVIPRSVIAPSLDLATQRT